jgi:hypothetical protein
MTQMIDASAHTGDRFLLDDSHDDVLMGSEKADTFIFSGLYGSSSNSTGGMDAAMGGDGADRFFITGYDETTNGTGRSQVTISDGDDGGGTDYIYIASDDRDVIVNMDEGSTAIEVCADDLGSGSLTINFTGGFTDTFLKLDVTPYYNPAELDTNPRGQLQFNFVDFELREDAPGSFNWTYEGSFKGPSNNTLAEAGSGLPYTNPYNPNNANALNIETQGAAPDYVDLDDDVMYVFRSSKFIDGADREITDYNDTQDVANFVNYFLDTSESDISDGGSGISLGESAMFIINEQFTRGAGADARPGNAWHGYVFTETNDNGKVDAFEITYFMCGEGRIRGSDFVEDLGVPG